MDPLTWQEYWIVLETLRDAERLDLDTRFSMINLREPSKEVVLKWKPGKKIPRAAFALVRQEKETFEAVAIHRGDGVRYRLGPVVDHEGLRLPAWVEIEVGDNSEPLRLEIRGPIPADATPEAFDPGWLRAP